MDNPWGPSGRYYERSPLQQQSFSWQSGNGYWSPKSQSQLKKEGLMQMAVLAAVLVAPALLPALGKGGLGAAKGAEAAGAAAGQGAAAKGGLSKVISVLAMLENPEGLMKAVSAGKSLFSQVFQRNSEQAVEYNYTKRYSTQSASSAASEIVWEAMESIARTFSWDRKLQQQALAVVQNKGPAPRMVTNLVLRSLERA